MIRYETCEFSVALDQIQGVDVWRENFEQVCLNLIHSLEKYKTHLPDCPFIKYNKLNDFERNIFPNPQSWAGHLLAEMGKHDYPSRALPFMTPVSSGHWANLAFPRVPFRQLGSLIQLMNNEHSLPLPTFCSEMRQRTNKINQRNQQTTSNRPLHSFEINWFIYECSGTWDMKMCHLTKQHINYPPMPVINTVENQESLELRKEGNAEGIECITPATPLSFKGDEHT